MDGFFGIGFGELVMIAIVALIVLGPERLPGALREVAKFIRMMRNLTREFTDQFGDEFKALEDLNPRRLLQDAIDDIDEEERSKEDATKAPAKKSTATTPKATPKATTPKATTPKATTPKATPSSTAAKAAPPKVDADKSATATGDSSTGDSPTAEPASTKTTDASAVDSAGENQIAPPEIVANAVSSPSTTPADSTTSADVDNAPVAAKPTSPIMQTNGHVPSAAANHTPAESHPTAMRAATELSSEDLRATEAVQNKSKAEQAVADESIVMSDPMDDEEKHP